MANKQRPKKGDLHVWWIPQVPMDQPFCFPVDTVIQARMLLDALASYDIFQLEHNIKPDFSNAGGLNVFDGKEWVDWYSADGNGIDAYTLEQIREVRPQWEATP